MAGLKIKLSLLASLSVWGLWLISGAKGGPGTGLSLQNQVGSSWDQSQSKVGAACDPAQARTTAQGQRWSWDYWFKSRGWRRRWRRVVQSKGRYRRRKKAEPRGHRQLPEPTKGDELGEAVGLPSEAEAVHWPSDQLWVQQQWGRVELGDQRRRHRAVRMAERMLAHPGGSLPEQMGRWAETKAAYRLLNEGSISLATLSEPHWQQTRQAAGQHQTVLMIQDSSELDYTAHPKTQGLGPIGDGRGRGFLIHPVLAVVADQPLILGLAHLQAVLRQARPPGQRKPKWMRSAEALLWSVAAKAVGRPPKGVRWVHTGDRGSDSFEFMSSCLEQPEVHFLIRVGHNRLLDWSQAEDERAALGETERYLLDYARTLPAQGPTFTVEVSPRKKEAKRQAKLQLSWSQVRIPAPKEAPKLLRHHPPLTAWLVRAWEVQPPPEVKKPLEWVLLSSLPVQTWSQARQRIDWYTQRWLIEEYFHALKTGCRVEQAQFDHRQDLERLLGFVSIIAVRLLQLRQLVQQAPQTPALQLVEPLEVQLVALHLKLEPATLTLAQFWLGVAQLGGHLGRKADGPPGWLTLWRGRRQLFLMAQGARLAGQLLSADLSALSILLLNSS